MCVARRGKFEATREFAALHFIGGDPNEICDFWNDRDEKS